ncbi:hypothetical protein HU200_013727 [Digitaria exilis]|uniref:NAD(P)H-quinone oxidoreductase subunit 6, chloroplastic n=1 Tax=Digitaria exilis TaxID=1010633 RepID=A0A835FDQ9_9POAL|nr:hypothetical protein HU200_013727 [Digitaria exilis]
MDLPGPIHEILVLGLVLVCISLFYFLLNSYFVAVAQLLIYVGAINVLIIFAVMFVNGSEWSKDNNYWTIGDGFTLLPSMWTLGEDQPVIPRVTFIR